MGFFDSLAELVQPLLNFIGLGPSHADTGIRKRIPFRNFRMAFRQKIAIARHRAFQRQQQKAMLQAQKQRVQSIPRKKTSFPRRKMP